jgi:hypothetical protein
MSSGGSYSDYTKKTSRVKAAFTGTDEEKVAALHLRSTRIAELRDTVTEREEPIIRDTSGLYDPKYVMQTISRPAEGVVRIHDFLFDNSGSNREIAAHLRKSSGYFNSVMNILDPTAQFSTTYFSDHTDGARFEQMIDYIFPNPEGDKVMFSTLRHTQPANGYDAAEAIECALWNACKKDFGKATERHLYLVTDVVGHGMGLASDDGCPYQRDWRDSLKLVAETYKSFNVVGCGDCKRTGELQKKFIAPERVPFDLIDLSGIEDLRYRLGITGNAILFLVARNTGLQGVEMFLSFLYEKWLEEPLFGANTDMSARQAIQRFAKYIEDPQDQIDKIMEKVLGNP